MFNASGELPTGVQVEDSRRVYLRIEKRLKAPPGRG